MNYFVPTQAANIFSNLSQMVGGKKMIAQAMGIVNIVNVVKLIHNGGKTMGYPHLFWSSAFCVVVGPVIQKLVVWIGTTMALLGVVFLMLWAKLSVEASEGEYEKSISMTEEKR